MFCWSGGDWEGLGREIANIWMGSLRLDSPHVWASSQGSDPALCPPWHLLPGGKPLFPTALQTCPSPGNREA